MKNKIKEGIFNNMGKKIKFRLRGKTLEPDNKIGSTTHAVEPVILLHQHHFLDTLVFP
jgi:hypothetical protein